MNDRGDVLFFLVLVKYDAITILIISPAHRTFEKTRVRQERLRWDRRVIFFWNNGVFYFLLVVQLWSRMLSEHREMLTDGCWRFLQIHEGWERKFAQRASEDRSRFGSYREIGCMIEGQILMSGT